MNHIHLIEWKDREAPWRDEITTEVRKFPLLVTELSECKHHTCCIVKPTILFCDHYRREAWCHDDEDFPEADIWTDQPVAYHNARRSRLP